MVGRWRNKSCVIVPSLDILKCKKRFFCFSHLNQFPLFEAFSLSVDISTIQHLYISGIECPLRPRPRYDSESLHLIRTFQLATLSTLHSASAYEPIIREKGRVHLILFSDINLDPTHQRSPTWTLWHLTHRLPLPPPLTDQCLSSFIGLNWLEEPLKLLNGLVH